MKLTVCSDLHLEFGPYKMSNPHDADVLILSGDICIAEDIKCAPDPDRIIPNLRYTKVKEFFVSCSKNYKHIIYVMGNHEHYHGDFELSSHILRNFLKYQFNIHFLDNEYIDIDGVRFIGSTLWTDMNKSDPNTMMCVQGKMNDYIQIKNFSPEISIEQHKKSLEFIKKSIHKNKRNVVVGHHSPSTKSIHPKYNSSMIINGGFSSDLSEFILENPQIKLWTHGHTHNKFDYTIGNTRIVCNPRGYDGYEETAYNFKLNLIEI